MLGELWFKRWDSRHMFLKYIKFKIDVKLELQIRACPAKAIFFEND
jgi:hypothetical protein